MEARHELQATSFSHIREDTLTDARLLEVVGGRRATMMMTVMTRSALIIIIIIVEFVVCLTVQVNQPSMGYKLTIINAWQKQY